MEFFSPPTPYKAPTALYDLLKHLGLTTSLTFVVDAGDSANYLGTQTLGAQPVGAPTLFMGNDANVDSFRDPTFVGTRGRQSTAEYWQTTCAATGSPANRIGCSTGTWLDNMHRDSATWTIAGVFRRNTTTDGWNLFADHGGDVSSIGISVAVASTNGFGGFPADRLIFDVGNGNGASYAAAWGTSSMTIPKGTDFFWAISLDEAAGNLIFQINGGQETQTGKTYASPSAGSNAFGIALLESTSNETGATGRIYNFSHWTRALNTTELMKLYKAQQIKFGI